MDNKDQKTSNDKDLDTLESILDAGCLAIFVAIIGGIILVIFLLYKIITFFDIKIIPLLGMMVLLFFTPVGQFILLIYLRVIVETINLIRETFNSRK